MYASKLNFRKGDITWNKKNNTTERIERIVRVLIALDEQKALAQAVIKDCEAEEHRLDKALMMASEDESLLHIYDAQHQLSIRRREAKDTLHLLEAMSRMATLPSRLAGKWFWERNPDPLDGGMLAVDDIRAAAYDIVAFAGEEGDALLAAANSQKELLQKIFDERRMQSQKASALRRDFRETAGLLNDIRHWIEGISTDGGDATRTADGIRCVMRKKQHLLRKQETLKEDAHELGVWAETANDFIEVLTAFSAQKEAEIEADKPKFQSANADIGLWNVVGYACSKAAEDIQKELRYIKARVYTYRAGNPEQEDI